MFGEYFIFLVLGGIVVGLIIAGYVAQQRKASRLQEMQAFAGSEGFDFYPDGLARKPKGFWESLAAAAEDPVVDVFEHFYPFNVGINKHAHNMLVKTVGDRCIYAMDFTYETVESDGKGSHRRRHAYTVVAIRHGFIWPSIRLSPETFEHRIARMFGMKELTLESEEFNKKYFVAVEDDKTAYDILHPQSIDFLLRIPARDWQMANMNLVVFGQGEMSVQEIRRVIQDMGQFIDLLPDYVKQDRGFVPKWQGALDF